MNKNFISPATNIISGQYNAIQIDQTKEMGRRNDYKKKYKKYQLWFPFLILPCYLLLCFCVVVQEMFLTFFETMPDWIVLLFVISFLSLFLICCLFLCRKYLAAKAKYQQLAQLQKLQKSHYTRLLEKRQDLEKLREDFVEQLKEIISCLETKNYPVALKQLNHLTNRIQATSEYPFCPNAVINSILTEAKNCCEKNSVSFHTELFIRPCPTVSNLHLCSIFSNLLDNALYACLALPEDTPRHILVTARQDTDYLHIKVANTAPAISLARSKDEGHGYGQKILRDIAKKYDGDFHTNHAAGIYETFLSLYIPSDEPS